MISELFFNFALQKLGVWEIGENEIPKFSLAKNNLDMIIHTLNLY